MRNHGLFSTLFIDKIRSEAKLDDAGQGRMATLAHTWENCDRTDLKSLWNTYIKQALSYLSFVPPASTDTPGVYPLYEDYNYSNCVAVLYLIEPGADMDDTSVGRFWPARLITQLRHRKLTWGILTDGERWRLYTNRTGKPFEEYVELNLAEALAQNDEGEYSLFETFFHMDSFAPEAGDKEERKEDARKLGVYTCRLDQDMAASEKLLEDKVKSPLLQQIDEVLQYICNGFIADTPRKGEEYTEDERREIFASAVKLLYRCLFLFYAESRSLLPSQVEKQEIYAKHSIQALCLEAHRFRWGTRTDHEGYDLWKHLKGLIHAVNDGDPEYGIMGYNGGLFDDEQEKFLGKQQLRNDFLARALYLMAYVEPHDSDPDKEYPIPYQNLEVRHLGEMYENILEFNVTLADADRLRRRTKKGIESLLASETTRQKSDSLIKKGDVYFGESALERKQTGSYYTPESLVRFLNGKTVIQPLKDRFAQDYRERFDLFIREAHEGHDVAVRRGAAQSAIALVERYVKEVVLIFKLCDPGMGSGHFLVNAADQITDLIVSLLAEIPDVEGMSSPTTCEPNHWRRLITRHCLYGVDLNPLAVHLAKLSLWLNCFARDHKLTFLDHHLRCGNSLIGIRRLSQLQRIPERSKDAKKKLQKEKNLRELPFPETLTEAFQKAARDMMSITQIAEDDTDRQKEMHEETRRERINPLMPLADLFTAYLMDSAVKPDEYHELFLRLAQGEAPASIAEMELDDKVKVLAGRHHFFHWPLEFPNVFNEENGGFDAAVGNPPWDMVSAQPAEFFEKYDASFRSLKRTESLKKMKELCRLHPEISKGWEHHQQSFNEANSLFNEPIAYKHGPTGRNNLYQYFLHRSYDILHPQGHIGIVLPGSFNADKGASSLRKLYFEKCSILSFFCFSNEKFIFKNVHHAFRFIVFSAKKDGKNESFKVCFLTDPREAVAPGLLEGKLQYLDRYGLEMAYQTVELLSPEKLSVLEFHRQRDADLAVHFYSVAGNLGKTSADLNFRFSIEMMSNNDAWRFDEANDSDTPVYAGRCFQQYDHKLADVSSFIPQVMLEDLYATTTAKPWNDYRVVFRDVTGGTSERTCISCILPPPNACLETARILYPASKEKLQSEQLQAYTIAILNSFCLDYIMRFMVRLHLSQHIMERAPFIRCPATCYAFKSLVARTTRLVATEKSFGQFWRMCFAKDWQSPDFWYPRIGNMDYGPQHEQDIRRRLAEEAANLTPEWSPACGVHDRTPNRRDTGDRAQLRAEVDAYVAHLYGLTRDDFAYILDTFPVLKRKEEQTFGEFMSKRKCLEEYDRIAVIL